MRPPDPGDEWGLVMPFVVCQDEGGPYEPDAFVAGVYYGQISHDIEHDASRPVTIGLFEYTVPAPLVPQLDLLAMAHGYTIDTTPADDWAAVVITRNDPE